MGEMKKNGKWQMANGKWIIFLLWAAFVFVKYLLVLIERGRIRSIWP